MKNDILANLENELIRINKVFNCLPNFFNLGLFSSTIENNLRKAIG